VFDSIQLLNFETTQRYVQYKYKTNCPNSWCTMMLTQALAKLSHNGCCYLEATVVWRYASARTWLLWKFTIPFLPFHTSLMKMLYITKCSTTTHSTKSHWPTPSLHYGQQDRVFAQIRAQWVITGSSSVVVPWCASSKTARMLLGVVVRTCLYCDFHACRIQYYRPLVPLYNLI
jgi:hypothetical protein